MRGTRVQAGAGFWEFYVMKGDVSWRDGAEKVKVFGEAHCLKLPTLARLPSNHLHQLFYDRRSR